MPCKRDGVEWEDTSLADVGVGWCGVGVGGSRPNKRAGKAGVLLRLGCGWDRGGEKEGVAPGLEERSALAEGGAARL